MGGGVKVVLGREAAYFVVAMALAEPRTAVQASTDVLFTLKVPSCRSTEAERR